MERGGCGVVVVVDGERGHALFGNGEASSVDEVWM